MQISQTNTPATQAISVTLKKQDHHQKCHCQANKVFRVFSSFVTSSTKVEYTPETCREEIVMMQLYKHHREV